MKHGDRYEWRPTDEPGDVVVQVEILEVAKDESWADLKCTPPAGRSWTKRMELPLGRRFRRVEDGAR